MLFRSLIRIAKTLVDKQYQLNNTRFYAWVDMDKSKIRGAFSKEMFLDAIDEVITDNYSSMIKKYLDKKDTKGKKAYTNETAIKAERQRLFSEYYGN